MDKNKDTIKNLNALLEVRDRQIEALTEELGRLQEEKEERNFRWCRPRRSEDEERNLPVPRLQLLMLENDGYSQEWEISLVTADISDTVTTPMEWSRRSGGDYGPLLQDLETTSDAHRFMPTLVTDFMRIARQMPCLPLYVIVGEHVWLCTLPQGFGPLHMLKQASLETVPEHRTFFETFSASCGWPLTTQVKVLLRFIQDRFMPLDPCGRETEYLTEFKVHLDPHSKKDFAELTFAALFQKYVESEGWDLTEQVETLMAFVEAYTDFENFKPFVEECRRPHLHRKTPQA